MNREEALIEVWENYNAACYGKKHVEVYLVEPVTENDDLDRLPRLTLAWLKARPDDKIEIEQEIRDILIAGAYEYFEGDIDALLEEQEESWSLADDYEEDCKQRNDDIREEVRK